MSEQPSSKDQLADLKKYHAEIVESDGAECEGMRLTRWAIEQIERLRRENDALAKLSSQWITEAQREKDARHSTVPEPSACFCDESLALLRKMRDEHIERGSLSGRLQHEAEELLQRLAQRPVPTKSARRYACAGCGKDIADCECPQLGERDD